MSLLEIREDDLTGKQIALLLQEHLENTADCGHMRYSKASHK
jgi:hypothetical protein